MIKIKFDRGGKSKHKFHGRIRVLWGEQKPFQREGFAISLFQNEERDSELPRRMRLQLDWGPGAGYKNGLTAYVAYNCKGTAGTNMYITRKWQYGITPNANLVPHHY